MSIVLLLIIVFALGIAAYFLGGAKWVAQPFRTILQIILIVIAVLVTLQAFGVLDKIRGAQVPRVLNPNLQPPAAAAQRRKSLKFVVPDKFPSGEDMCAPCRVRRSGTPFKAF